MGRKPNPIILEFFERGAKLNDNSNRYHHSCKSCGENFPKGRYDSLINHLTKKCPALSKEARTRACLTVHGINNTSNHSGFGGLLHTGPNHGPFPGHPQGHSPAPSLEQSQNQIWTPLETLAEVSRQFEANEKHDDHAPVSQDPAAEAVQTTLASAVVPVAATTNSFELHEQFTLENPPTNLDSHSQRDFKDINLLHKHSDGLTPEERLRRAFEAKAVSPTHSALSVAMAATAHLNTSLLDPQLMTDEAIHNTNSQNHSTDILIEYPSSPERHHAVPNTAESTAPWEGMTYMSEDIHAPATVNDHGQHLAATLNRGGFRMDTTNTLNGARHRHSRARFDTSRRKEVQEIRRIGACIRCRILRKTCSKGTPCNACKKVLAPRIWRTGCVRTKLSEHINLYSAGVQVVMAQKRINSYKTTHNLQNNGLVLEVSHFPDTGHKATFKLLQGTPKEKSGTDDTGPGPVILLDNNEDIPTKVEAYMRENLNEFIRREPSQYVSVTLDIAVAVANDTNDELLKRSLELWGIVEMMDRERQWTMLVKGDAKEYLINDDSDSEAYTNICMQLTAAAERKASAASKVLLNGIQKHLQDGKAKLGFPMFLTVMLFLNCMEKTTWAFKAWDQENLRPKWPLEKPPSSFTSQGQELTELLRMLLVIRHILPKTMAMGPDSPIVANDNDPAVQNYFHLLNVTTAYLESRRDQNNFQPTDSRSLEFLFCAPLLLNN
ncbi:hypothetical protein F4774DRAFT_407023 [Daldinia eschscholtzii]|nr:hypothetical protein F4774DRAFT_407023 [Daldinia eschscholtzii]